jgi:hypothetical protein
MNHWGAAGRKGKFVNWDREETHLLQKHWHKGKVIDWDKRVLSDESTMDSRKKNWEMDFGKKTPNKADEKKHRHSGVGGRRRAAQQRRLGKGEERLLILQKVAKRRGTFVRKCLMVSMRTDRNDTANFFCPEETDY